MSSTPLDRDRDVVLLVDTFNRYFEPENARAACAVLSAAGYVVHVPRPQDGSRPLCCGRSFLAQGMVAEARIEAQRMLEALRPYLERGIAVVGLEPSCLLTLRDEYLALLPESATALAQQALLLEEFLDARASAGQLRLALHALPGKRKALLHGHCHQKAFGVMSSVERVLRMVPELEVEPIVSSCCGMAGSFGYEAAHFEISMRMGEAILLPRVREAASDSIIVADGTSCRHQIHDGTGRFGLHVARVLQLAQI